MKKNVLVLAVVAATLGGLTGCKKSLAAGSQINIMCWNNEFQGRFNAYYPDIDTDKNGGDIVKGVDTKNNITYLKNGMEVHFKITPTDGNAYQNALDAALPKQKDSDSTKKDNDKIDIFLLEADYATKYVNTDYTLDVKNDVGLTDSNLSEMYDYTKTVVTDTRTSAKTLKGVSWQATPGLFAYRNDLAKAVYSDYPADPAEGDTDAVKATKAAAQAAYMQDKMSDWTKFDQVAADMKAANHKMVSGYDDMYRVFSNNATQSWVDDSKVVHVDDQIKNWVKKTKDYTGKGYCGDSKLWSDGWAADQGPSGNVFGFFYSTWGINFTLKGNSLADAKGAEKLGNGLFGQYRVCEGPAAYYWGGTWISAAKGTDNLPEVKDIMEKMTCDKAIAKQITIDTLDYTNNKAAMNEIANDANYGSAFLGGQNHIRLFAKSAANIKLGPISAYDQGCNEQYQGAMRDYFAGTSAFAAANTDFQTKLNTKYTGLTYDPKNASLD
ncbi:MAG: carbohydrate ABC transporter substrate-binding protein [Bacilli bacterium]